MGLLPENCVNFSFREASTSQRYPGVVMQILAQKMQNFDLCRQVLSVKFSNFYNKTLMTKIINVY